MSGSVSSFSEVLVRPVLHENNNIQYVSMAYTREEAMVSTVHTCVAWNMMKPFSFHTHQCDNDVTITRLARTTVNSIILRNITWKPRDNPEIRAAGSNFTMVKMCLLGYLPGVAILITLLQEFAICDRLQVEEGG